MAIITIRVPEDVSKKLAKIDVPGTKEPIKKIHITMFYFPKELKLKESLDITEAIFKIVSNANCFDVEFSEVSSFPEGDDGFPIIMKIKSKELEKLRKDIAKELDAGKFEYSKKFEYIPHVTLSYSKEKINNFKIDNAKFEVNEIEFWAGENASDNLSIKIQLNKSKHSQLINKINIFEKFANSL